MNKRWPLPVIGIVISLAVVVIVGVTLIGKARLVDIALMYLSGVVGGVGLFALMRRKG